MIGQLHLLLPAGALLAIALVWFAASERTDDAEQITLGRNLYDAHCASCHGANLEGQPNWQVPLPDGKMPAPPLNASGHAPHHADVELFRVVKEGAEGVNPARPSDMPAFGNVLSDDEIRAVIDFIKSSW
jgi:mono/diheme cytochrome c family protein